MQTSLFIFLAITARAFASPVNASGRDGKALSLFSVVTFPNDQCSSSESGITGVCLSSTECSDKGGTKSGNCAAGFGACCTFRVTACGGTASNNCTYLENDGYPTVVTTASQSCAYTVSPMQSDICQLRLDLDNFVLPNTATTGLCTTIGSTMAIQSATGKDPPSICGTSTGSHMYVETGTSSTATTITITTGTGTTNRSWRIKVTQIECSSLAKAPQDCLQYYTGASGILTSFGFGAGLSQQDLNYAICMRQEIGYCAINYYTNTAITTPDPYMISDDANAEAVSCADGKLTIPHLEISDSQALAIRATAYYCGTILSPVDGQTTASVFRQVRAPFHINVAHPVSSVAAATGFSLVYNQIPC